MAGKRLWVAALTAMAACVPPALGQVQITEFMYDGVSGEFVEFTNRGGAAVDFTGWTFDDDGATAGTVDLSSFGIVNAGESVVVAQATDATAFRTNWGIPVAVKVVTYTVGQLQRNDTIRLFDSGAALVTQLAYGDQTFVGTIRTQNRSGWPCAEVIGTSPINLSWNLSAVADAQGSFAAADTNIGSPGFYTHHFCIAPPTGACCAFGLCEDGVTESDCVNGAGTYQGDNSECLNVACPAPSSGAIKITEYMYTGTGLEFVEFTNLDNHPIDMTGWSYDDDSATAGSVDLSAFGVVMPGESAILCEADAATFIADWNLAGVAVIGGSTHNLSRNDQINLFDNTLALADRLSFGDQTFPGTIRTQNVSGYPCEDAVGANNIFLWFLSVVGDAENSYVSSGGDIGNPGLYVDVLCPVCGNGTVDVGEDCDSGDCCLNCEFVAQGTECRAPAGDCDVPEACTGDSADCPTDEVAANGFECRPAAGDCDLPEACDGVSVDCPPDAVEPMDTLCRLAVGDCDLDEVCDGTSPDCPADAVEDAGAVCRPALGVCDAEEACDGTSPDCPPDAVLPDGAVCSDSAGDCDVEESCNGVGVDCPTDSLINAGVECRGSAGPCDPAEDCTGNDPSCPPDDLAGAGTPCRLSTGPCDPEESCDGAVVTCPADAVITQCIGGDGCCPSGCNANNDTDCIAICGNNLIEPGEGCDDGNTDDGDGCSGTCQLEFVPIPTVSEWGLVALALMLLIAAKVRGSRERELTA